MSAPIDHRQFAQGVMPFAPPGAIALPAARFDHGHRRLAAIGFVALNAASWAALALGVWTA